MYRIIHTAGNSQGIPDLTNPADHFVFGEGGIKLEDLVLLELHHVAKSSFQPVFGRVFTLFNPKWAYLISMFVFEIGSIISGFAPSSPALIIGRAIAGFGSAGILTGSFVIVATAVPLNVRPIYTAVVGLMYVNGAQIVL